MHTADTKLEMVRRHVEHGARCIAKQRALIARLQRRGLPTEEAKAFLVAFEAMQHQHEDHLMRIVSDQA